MLGVGLLNPELTPLVHDMRRDFFVWLSYRPKIYAGPKERYPCKPLILTGPTGLSIRHESAPVTVGHGHSRSLNRPFIAFIDQAVLARHVQSARAPLQAGD